MFKKIKRMSAPVAVFVMILCMLGGVALGNQNALNSAVKDAGVSLLEITELVDDRVTHGGYMLRLATRVLPGESETKALESALLALEGAKRADQIAIADRELSAAVIAVESPLRQKASAVDSGLFTNEKDELISLERMLSRAAVAYNNSLADAQKVHDGLPLKFLLSGMPEAYR